MKNSLLHALLVFVAGASYGILVPIVKMASLHGLSVPAFLPSQYMFAFVVTFIFVLARRIKLGPIKDMFKLALLGVCAACTSLCYYTCLTLLPSAVALTLLFQYVWVGVLIECLVDHHLPSKSTVIAICIVLVGTVLAAGIFEEGAVNLSHLGVATGFGSAFFYGLFLFLSGRLGVDYSVPVRITMLCLGGFIVMCLFHPTYFSTSMLVVETWPYAIALGCIGILVPVTLLAIASPHLSTGAVNVLASAELPVGIIAAWIILGESPSALTLFGIILVLVGIAYKALASTVYDKIVSSVASILKDSLP